jgi:hypothetical protein
MKKLCFWNALFALMSGATAQVSTTQTLFHYQLTAIQPTALPNHYLDYFDDDKQNLSETPLPKWYLNVSNRNDLHPQTGNAWTNLVAIDRIPDPNKLKFQFGGGIQFADLEAVQFIAPFFHLSVGKSLTQSWRILGGLGYQYATQRLPPDRILYKDLDDPKIALAQALMQQPVNTFSVSAAAVQTKHCYIGLGYNRIIENNQYNTLSKNNFSELNFALEYIFKFKLREFQDWTQRHRQQGAWAEIPKRGFGTNVRVSVLGRYLLNADYPFHAQCNLRMSLHPLFWGGVGWNTAQRFQIQAGLVKIPVFKTKPYHSEYWIWFGYDLQTLAAPRHGVEIQLGYAF